MMRFLVDECTGPGVAKWLADQGYDVFSIYEKARGLDDESIIKTALAENRILITNDKDFGDKVYRDGRLHQGVILLRLSDERTAAKIQVPEKLFKAHADRLPGSFLVVTEERVRFAG